MGNFFEDSKAVNEEVANVVKEYSKTDNAILFEMIFKYMRYYLSLIAFGVLSKSLLLYSLSSDICSFKILLIIPALVFTVFTASLAILWVCSSIELTGEVFLKAPGVTEFYKKYHLGFFNNFSLNFVLLPSLSIIALVVILSLKLPLF